MGAPFFDTHCHLQDSRFGVGLDADAVSGLGPDTAWGSTRGDFASHRRAGGPPSLISVLDRAYEQGVTHMVCCGTREGDWGRVLELSRQHTAILPMLGLHPWYAHEAQPGWLERLEILLKNNPAGLGECGLDFALEAPDRPLQETVFRSQLRLAVKLNRPLSIHCRRAWEPLATLARKVGLPPAGAVVHAFSGSAEVARELQALGFHLSFSCSLANPANHRGAKAVRVVAEDRLLFETDAPDLPPIPGTLNEPANIHWVAEASARLRGTDLETATALAYRNSKRIFGGLLP